MNIISALKRRFAPCTSSSGVLETKNAQQKFQNNDDYCWRNGPRFWQAHLDVLDDFQIFIQIALTIEQCPGPGRREALCKYHTSPKNII